MDFYESDLKKNIDKNRKRWFQVRKPSLIIVHRDRNSAAIN